MSTLALSGYSGYSGPNGTSGVSGFSGFSGVKYTATTTPNTTGDNFSIAGFDYVRFSVAGVFSGFAAPAGGIQTRATLSNVSSGTITLLNNSTSSLAANRLITGTNTDYVLRPGATVDIVYNTVGTKWFISSPLSPPVNNYNITSYAPTSTYNISMIKLNNTTMASGFEFYEDRWIKFEISSTGVLRAAAASGSFGASFIGWNRKTAASATLPAVGDNINQAAYGSLTTAYTTITNLTWDSATNANFCAFHIELASASLMKYLITIQDGAATNSRLLISVERWDPTPITANEKITLT